MEYIGLTAGWVIYLALHSIFASEGVKRKIALNARTYRRIYSILAVAGLFILLLINESLGGERLLPRTGLIRYLSLFISAAGVLVAREAFRNYRISEFLGFTEEKNTSMNTQGIYAYVRHPLYTATLLVTAGFFLFDSRPATLISVLCMWIYLVPGIYFEEKKLVALYGDRYREYRRRVKAVIPFIL